MSAFERLQAALVGRDPETLVGPLLHLFTRLVAAPDRAIRETLADHLTALAAHPGVDPQLRLAAGALAIEHRAGAIAPLQ
ncbi:MAG: hypothetical protein U1F51_08880 [Burkholderiales bacterium]